MALMPAACLIVVCVFALLRQCDAMWHWIHRALFTGLTFYIPPSDATIQALLPKGAVSHLSSKTRKRLAKRAGLAPGSLKPMSSLSAAPSESFDLTWASIPRAAFVKAGNSSFGELRNYLGVHLVLLMLVFVEQSWVCYHTTNSTRFDDGTATIEMGAHVTSPTIVMLIVSMLYNLYVGLHVFARGTSGSGSGAAYWNRVTFALAFLFFMLSWFMQHMRSAAGSLLSAFLGAGDEQLYARYANQLAYSLLQKLHTVFREAQTMAAQEHSKDLVREWLPVLPASPSEMRADSYLSLSALKIILAMLCSAISVCFFTSSWRVAKLMHEKIEENEERLAEGTAVASTAAAAPAAAADADESDKPMSVRDRLSLHLSSLLQYVNLFSPFVVILLWLPPFSSQLWLRLFAQSLSSPGATEDSVARSLLVSWRSFELFRVAFIVGAIVLRLVLVRSVLQVWLLSSLSAIKRLPASTSALPENHIAVRMKALLNATFWVTPLMAWQYLYPLCCTLVLLCAWKLASEWMPPGSDSEAALHGWGVCFAVWGRGWSMSHVPANYLRAATDSAAAAPAPAAAPARPLTAADLDADEFEGDLAAIEVAAAAESTASPPLHSLPPSSLTPSGFSSPSHSNVLATAVGFLLWWCHVAWFVETVLCYSYLRYNKRVSQKTQYTPAVTMSKMEIDGGGSNGSSAASSSSSSAAGLQQRRPAA